ncbi:hypothetical protein [Halosimplex pelagicum]|uniref:Uncharacterized protein n=1 Tax=Halosimplex pelagicum TaxID=869886 RepID=A0A7D5P8Y8_9EURY|nr:hypothetical protein [Halosimplex pelagicum]QLH82201.1 hypothetical protein HZS54_11545 [Halosimplex pelagicum]
MKGAGSAPTTQIRTLERTDISELVPARLEDLDYSVYDQLTDFQHRGSRCEVDRMISHLGAAIENEAVMRGEESTPVTFHEFEAVEIVLDALQSKYPAWFGDNEALADLEKPVSDNHLSTSDLKEAYFGEQINPETSSVGGDDWTDQKRVIIPLLAIVLSRVREQLQKDSEASTNAAQQTIKRTILREAYEHDLDETEIGVAVDAALQSLDEL